MPFWPNHAAKLLNVCLGFLPDLCDTFARLLPSIRCARFSAVDIVSPGDTKAFSEVRNHKVPA